MKRYWKHIVKSTDAIVEDFLRKQIKDPAQKDVGRMPSDVIEGKHTIYLLTDSLCSYFCEDSRFYKEQEVFEAVKRGIAFVERWQRPDGSLDFPTCNFYSAPDTGFCFRRLYGAYEILCKYGSTPEEYSLKERYLKILLRCIPIMIYGGFHTPNHRWAVMSVLYILVNLTKEYGELALEMANMKEWMPEDNTRPRTPEQLVTLLIKRAEEYLVEGIDGDEDGEYAERSTGNYNAVVDKSLISAYEATGNEKFLGYVERNLQMMLYYFDGDDTIFTQNSTRQDHGKALYPDQYFYLYVYMADKTGNKAFDCAAHKIIKDNMERGDRAQDSMYIFMMYDWLKNYTFQGYGFLDTYRKYFKGSQVLRVKKEKYVYSVLNKKASFFFLKFGNLPMGIRIGEAYCEVRNFIPQSLEDTKDGCILRAKTRGWYYQPFSEYQGTSDWWEMDQNKREKVYTSELDLTFTVKELDNGLAFTVKSEGLSGMPLRVEIELPSGCNLENENFSLTTGKCENLILKNGYVNLHDDGQKITIGPGYGTHSFKGHYSGEIKNENGYSIFLNEYTPYDKTFTITKED